MYRLLRLIFTLQSLSLAITVATPPATVPVVPVSEPQPAGGNGFTVHRSFFRLMGARFVVKLLGKKAKSARGGRGGKHGGPKYAGGRARGSQTKGE